MRLTEGLAGPLSAAVAALYTACLLLVLAVPAAAQDGSVLETEATGPVTPVMANHLADALEEAQRGGHAALIVRLDTPGGLVTAMRDIVKSFLNADVPVVVWVSPAGAGAASAGYLITSAAHIAAMAPGTNIGAATPIDLEQGEVLDKIVNDAAAYARAIADARGRDVDFAEEATVDGASLSAEEAVERNVVDLVAATRDDLLRAIDGRTIEVAGGRQVQLDTTGVEIVSYEASWARRVLQRLADPNIAFLFMSIGTLAILYELAQPGVGAGAAVGVILIVLALFALAVLPVNTAGLALLGLAIALFVGEIFAPGIGVLAAGGTVALLLAGLFLFQRPTGVGVDLRVLIPTVVLAGLAAAGLAVVAARSRSAPVAAGPEPALNETTTVRRIVGDRAQVFVGGAWWNARSPTRRLQQGDEVRVVGRRDLELVVEPVEDATSDNQEGTP
ncbi:MAG: nodulation protein NfeD [Actinomycetota bacterium]|nr:nodulation protein NfeD [Actinomycetota bacterium]